MDAIAPLLEFVRHRPRLVVLTGAGCSTAAGIPDYRDADGDWKRAAPMQFQSFVSDALARKRYWARSMIGWRTMAHARPAPAHRALARLESAGHVVLLVTQNVDGLHGVAGSRKVIDLHGRIDTVCCLACGLRLPRVDLQHLLLAANPEWTHLEARSAPDGDADLEGRDFSAFQVPDCPHCDGMLKPDVVFFGENVPRERVHAARAALADADALLVAGSSLMVYSGYRLVEQALAQNLPVAAVNVGRTRADAHFMLKVCHDTGAALEALAEGMASPTVPMECFTASQVQPAAPLP